MSCRLAQQPGSDVVLKDVRKVIKRRDTEAMLTAAAPANVLERSGADASFLAAMLIDKLAWHLPLSRQHPRLLDAGITLSRCTLVSWASRAIDRPGPMVEAQSAHVLSSRQTRTRAVVETFWRWCRAQCHRPERVPKSPLAKALNDAQARRAGLEVVLDDPEVAIDTNHLERALRPIPLGKRNGLFASSEVGAQRVGIIRSLLVTCRRHEVDACTCLVDGLQRISVHPAKRAIELTPRMWKSLFADAPMRSDLGARHHDPPPH